MKKNLGKKKDRLSFLRNLFQVSEFWIEQKSTFSQTVYVHSSRDGTGGNPKDYQARPPHGGAAVPAAALPAAAALKPEPRLSPRPLSRIYKI